VTKRKREEREAVTKDIDKEKICDHKKKKSFVGSHSLLPHHTHHSHTLSPSLSLSLFVSLLLHLSSVFFFQRVRDNEMKDEYLDFLRYIDIYM